MAVTEARRNTFRTYPLQMLKERIAAAAIGGDPDELKAMRDELSIRNAQRREVAQMRRQK